MNSVNIALAGNPNSGKTTLFNELVRSKQYVGNWPGVTAEIFLLFRPAFKKAAADVSLPASVVAEGV